MKNNLKEIAKVFSKLGIFAYGGPAAHIAMMEEEIVEKRGWLTRQKFMDLIGLTSLIPGPNSSEMAIHLGLIKGGVPGLFIAGLTFMLPAMISVLILAIIYVKFGYLPQFEFIFEGIKPVVVAIVASALYRLGRKLFNKRDVFIFFIAAAALSILGIREIPIILLGGVLMLILRSIPRGKGSALAVEPISLILLFLVFLKIGSVLYGSGYVLLAFIKTELIEVRHVLTEKQLIDAIAIGQLTPGPLFTTATFIGYVLGGIRGALLATAGIFLPSFVFVLALSRFLERLGESKIVRNMLDGVTGASIGLMVSVLYTLAGASLTGPASIAIFLVSLFLIMRFKVNSAYLIVCGGLIGYIMSVI